MNHLLNRASCLVFRVAAINRSASTVVRGRGFAFFICPATVQLRDRPVGPGPRMGHPLVDPFDRVQGSPQPLTDQRVAGRPDPEWSPER
jgi:hypothetical protein